ncbi:hypothetical protein Goklo_003006 [Gossypium klotzschianum]|uniref:DUF4283 domain-containing protein n=1 Tax=Gossypium klotzschianum TaxID=34286 RepID=A0A7J8VUZ8_9ROSI|nr:hypothetical protein [Gossypium klotzschianum]
MSEQPVTVPGRISNKVRCREEEPSDEGGDLETLGAGMSKLFSFKDAVLNTGPMNNTMDDEWEVDDLDLREDDVRNDVVDGVPSIEFSDRVYGLAKKSMSKTLVVKLLGRKIGYNALWNKVCALWKPKMRFPLMNIDNDYYLAKFESDLDYNNVVSKGPWVIFGHYLTIQSWSTQFSTLEDFPLSVWLGSVF